MCNLELKKVRYKIVLMINAYLRRNILTVLLYIGYIVYTCVYRSLIHYYILVNYPCIIIIYK